MGLVKSEIENLKKIIENESMQLTSLLPKKTFANNHKAIRGKRPIVFKRMIDIMYKTGNTWETGKTTREIAMQLYDNYEKDIEEARKLGAKVGKEKEYINFIIQRYCFKTQQQIAFARTRLSEKLKEINISRESLIIPYYSGKASSRVYFKKGSDSFSDKITELRYFWHTDNESLEKLRVMFTNLMEKFFSRVSQVENAKKDGCIDKKIQIGLLNLKLDNINNKKRKVVK